MYTITNIRDAEKGERKIFLLSLPPSASSELRSQELFFLNLPSVVLFTCAFNFI